MDLERNEEGNRRASQVWDQLFFLPGRPCIVANFYHNLRSQIFLLLGNVTLRSDRDFLILENCQGLNTLGLFLLVAKTTKTNSVSLFVVYINNIYKQRRGRG